jgi:hypothetical protein
VAPPFLCLLEADVTYAEPRRRQSLSADHSRQRQLHIAFDKAYALDRSSIYGFFLKPMVSALSRVAGLWLAIVVQVLLIAPVLWGQRARWCPVGLFRR